MLIPFLKLIFSILCIAAAVSARAKKPRPGPIWRWGALPLCIGSPAVLVLPLPIYLWTIAAWCIGIVPAWWINRRRLDELVPWSQIFGPTHHISGVRLLLPSQVARNIRRAYNPKGKT